MRLSNNRINPPNRDQVDHPQEHNETPLKEVKDRISKSKNFHFNKHFDLINDG